MKRAARGPRNVERQGRCLYRAGAGALQTQGAFPRSNLIVVGDRQRVRTSAITGATGGAGGGVSAQPQSPNRAEGPKCATERAEVPTPHHWDNHHHRKQTTDERIAPQTHIVAVRAEGHVVRAEGSEDQLRCVEGETQHQSEHRKPQPAERSVNLPRGGEHTKTSGPLLSGAPRPSMIVSVLVMSAPMKEPRDS